MDIRNLFIITPGGRKHKAVDGDRDNGDSDSSCILVVPCKNDTKTETLWQFSLIG